MLTAEALASANGPVKVLVSEPHQKTNVEKLARDRGKKMCIRDRDDGMHIYTSGATNIFRYPELSDKQSAQEIISAFEEKQQLSELVTQTLAQEDNTGIQVYIGDETPVQTMKDCSVVTATYELGEGMKGTIGIIGPKRMDYEHVLKSLKKLQSELDAIFHKSE